MNSSVLFLHSVPTVSLRKIYKVNGSCEPSPVWHATGNIYAPKLEYIFFFSPHLSVSVAVILGKRTETEM